MKRKTKLHMSILLVVILAVLHCLVYVSVNNVETSNLYTFTSFSVALAIMWMAYNAVKVLNELSSQEDLGEDNHLGI